MAQVLGSIEEQGKLTPELKKQIEASADTCCGRGSLPSVPPKRRTRAIIAREKRSGTSG